LNPKYEKTELETVRLSQLEEQLLYSYAAFSSKYVLW